MKIRRGVFFWFPFDSSGSPWFPFGHPLGSCGSLWSALGLPLAGLGVPLAILGHMEPCWNSYKIPTITYERGCNCTSKPMVLDERGEKTSKIMDIHYRQMCQIHDTVFKKTAFWNLPPEPAEVVSASAAQTLPSTRAGGQDDGS